MKNDIDFYLRNLFRFKTTISEVKPIPLTHQKLQVELTEFFNLWPLDFWRATLPIQKSPLNVLDIGARDFFMAPTLVELFQKTQRDVFIEGIELDSYRRMTNFKTRADWGNYYSRKFKDVSYHSMDFLKWQKPADFIFNLNPFVTLGPLVNWGLPKKYFQPEDFFTHCRKVLKEGGVMMLGAPTENEMEIATELAHLKGFYEISDVRVWIPREDTIQKRPRYACFFS